MVDLWFLKWEWLPQYKIGPDLWGMEERVKYTSEPNSVGSIWLETKNKAIKNQNQPQGLAWSVAGIPQQPTIQPTEIWGKTIWEDITSQVVEEKRQSFQWIWERFKSAKEADKQMDKDINKWVYSQEEFNMLPVYKKTDLIIKDKQKYIADQIRLQYKDNIPEWISDEALVNDFYAQKPNEVNKFLKDELDKVGWYIENVKWNMVINYKPYKDMTPKQRLAFDQRDMEDDMKFWEKYKIKTEWVREKIDESVQRRLANPAYDNWDYANREEKVSLIKDEISEPILRTAEGIAKLYNILWPWMWELATMIIPKRTVESEDWKLVEERWFQWDSGKAMLKWIVDFTLYKVDQLKNDPEMFLEEALENPADVALFVQWIAETPALLNKVRTLPKAQQSIIRKAVNIWEDLKKWTVDVIDNIKNTWKDMTDIAEKEIIKDIPAIPDNKVKNYIDKSIWQSVVGKKTMKDVERFYDDTYNANKSIIQNKENLKLTDVDGNEIIWQAPETLVQRSEALDQTKTNLINKYKTISKEAWVSTDINLYSVIDDLEKYKETLPDITGKWGKKYVDDLITELKQKKTLPIEKVEAELEALNKELTNWFKNPQRGQSIQNDIDNQFRYSLRKALNDTIEFVADWPEYWDLKMQVKSLLSIEKQVNQKMIVELRKVSKWLTDLPEVFIQWEFGAWAIRLLMWDVSWWIIDIGKAAVMKWVKNWIKSVNSKDANVKRLFKYMEEQWVGKWINIEKSIERARQKIKALPYKWEIGETPKTIISPSKKITVTPEGEAVRAWNIQETSRIIADENKNISINRDEVMSKPVKDNTLTTKPKEDGMNNKSNSVRNDSDTMSKEINEVIPQNKVILKAPEDPLITEAKKYKTADEFVNAQKNIHRPPEIEWANTLDNLSDVYPDDIYSKDWLRYYWFQGTNADVQSYNIIKKMKWNPDWEVTLYRAIIPWEEKTIKPWDWVTFSKDYAKQHWESSLKWNYEIIELKAKAKELTTAWDDLNEWWYRPNNHKDIKREQLKQIREEANNK